MDDRLIRDYARVIVRSGVALREGQPLRIMTETVNSGFARTLAFVEYVSERAKQEYGETGKQWGGETRK